MEVIHIIMTMTSESGCISWDCNQSRLHGVCTVVSGTWCVCVGTYNIELLLDGVCPQISLQFDLSGLGVDGEEVWSVAESNNLVGRLPLKDQQTVK